MNVQNYWNNAVNLRQYLENTEKKIAELENASAEVQENEKYEYYKLGLTRMNRVIKTYKPLPEEIDELETKNFTGKILIISEGWCGDASMIVPVINRFFEGRNEVKITYRDESNLIDSFLTNGGKSIPIVLILNEKNDVISHWGPRPEFGNTLLKKHKENPEEYDADTFHNDLQIYYTKNKGKDIIEELLTKI